MKYPLTQTQYAKVYRVNERTVRRWQDKEFPLDDPVNLLRTLREQKNKPSSLDGVCPGDLLAHLRAESDPEAMRLDVQRELATRISDGTILLQQARDLARVRWEEWPELASRLNAIVDRTGELLNLIGVDENTFDWDEVWRPAHLAGEGMIHSWGTDPERAKAHGKRLVWADAEPEGKKRRR